MSKKKRPFTKKVPVYRFEEGEGQEPPRLKLDWVGPATAVDLRKQQAEAARQAAKALRKPDAQPPPLATPVAQPQPPASAEPSSGLSASDRNMCWRTGLGIALSVQAIMTIPICYRWGTIGAAVWSLVVCVAVVAVLLADVWALWRRRHGP